MKRVPWLCVFASTIAALGIGVATASSPDSGFRCPSGRLVSRGDHMVEVRSKCGDPDFVDQRVEKRKVKVKVKKWVDDHVEEVSEEQEVEVLVDEWTYDMGPRRFVRFVAFENSRVVGVTTGGKGSS